MHYGKKHGIRGKVKGIEYRVAMLLVTGEGFFCHVDKKIKCVFLVDVSILLSKLLSFS